MTRDFRAFMRISEDVMNRTVKAGISPWQNSQQSRGKRSPSSMCPPAALEAGQYPDPEREHMHSDTCLMLQAPQLSVPADGDQQPTAA